MSADITTQEAMRAVHLLCNGDALRTDAVSQVIRWSFEQGWRASEAFTSTQFMIGRIHAPNETIAQCLRHGLDRWVDEAAEVLKATIEHAVGITDEEPKQ